MFNLIIFYFFQFLFFQYFIQFTFNYLQFNLERHYQSNEIQRNLYLFKMNFKYFQIIPN